MSTQDARPSSAPEPAGAGDTLDGRFRLVARLGQGGFGDVWRADELLPDGAPFRQVALKLLLPGGGDAVDWAEEAKLLASFRHPSLVTIYAAGILAGTPPQRFVAMELLEGQNLSDLRAARGPVAWRRVLGWAMSAAAALDLIHVAGVVHLDLKPANLFLGADGALKVLDFGIARRAGVEAVVARRGARLRRDATARDVELATGLMVAGRVARSHEEEAFAATHRARSGGPEVVIGTPGFMAPEVLELAEPTAAADAYALAVCVVQLVTGHLPHAAPDEPAAWDDPTAVSAWLDAIRRATLRGSLRSFDEGRLPRGLAALLRRLLEVDPARRGVVPGTLRALFEEAWQRPHGVPDPPYFGLRPYPPEAEGLLFGRDDDLTRLGRELALEPCLVLQGAAGSGKSSLLAAGLVPSLGKAGADGKDDWIAAPIVPADDAGLAAALARLSPELEDAGAGELEAFCRSSPVGVVLVLDPIEDAARSGPGEAERGRLHALVTSLATGAARPGLRIAGALGEDGRAALLGSPLGQAVHAALRFVGGPAAAAVDDIVAAPAQHAGVLVLGVEAVAADVQRELRAGSGRLPFVALALEEWWRGRSGAGGSDGATLRGERWKETGGVRGAVVRHAERVIAALEPGPRALAQELLLRLSATDGAPLRWDEPELCALVAGEAEPDRAEASRLLARLDREHLVRVEGGAVEIAHPALLKDWAGLASARLANMDRLSLLERLREARIAWERADNHRDFLLHGALFDEARTRRALLARGLGPADRAFFRESRRAARFRGARRAAIGAFVLLSLAGGVRGKHMVDDARAEEARTRAHAAELEQLAELAAMARRTEDPYPRAALDAAALARGSSDGVLPLDLLATAGNLARAEIVTLARVDAPRFPWDDRFLLGSDGDGTLAVVDFRPPEPDVIEDVDLDFDPAEADSAHFKKPALARLRPHEAPLVERVDLAFDTAFATRASTGEVKVFRLRDDGRPALAAIAPMRCTGPLHAAAAAPVLACSVEGGVARWDLRRRAPAEAVVTQPFLGEVDDVSADGERVAAIADRSVLLWTAGSAAVTYAAPRAVTRVRFAPSAHAAALLEGAPGEGAHVEIVDDRRPERPLLAIDPLEARPDRLRWDDGGLDLGVCEASGGRWYYLRRGGRAKDDAPPKGDPCAPPRPRGQPEPITAPEDAPELADRDVGPHLPTGGWRLHRHRYLTRDLVVLDAAAGRALADAPDAPPPPAAARLLRFEGRDEIGSEEPVGPADSVTAVERDAGVVMFQVGDEMRFYSLPEGTRLFARRGNFLRRCLDGRWLAWEAEGARYRILDAASGGTVAHVAREPGFVLGASAACHVLYTQRLDGTLVEHGLDAGGDSRPARAMGTADGYAFDVRPSPARGDLGSGLLVAFSSGAVARIDDATRSVRVLGYATPRAHAITDGPEPGDALVADGSGVALLRPGQPPAWLQRDEGAGDWMDLSLAPDHASLLLTAPDRVAVLDVTRRHLLGSVPVHGKDRMARWDDEGSVLLWSYDRRGGPEGTVIPRGRSLARQVAAAVSNLTVEEGRVAIRR
jgi:serine/threonine protein kinase